MARHDARGKSPVARDAGIEVGVAIGFGQGIEIDLARGVARDVDHALALDQRLEAQQVSGAVAAMHGVQTKRIETEPRSWNRTRTLSPGLTSRASVTPPVMMKLPAGMC